MLVIDMRRRFFNTLGGGGEIVPPTFIKGLVKVNINIFYLIYEIGIFQIALTLPV